MKAHGLVSAEHSCTECWHGGVDTILLHKVDQSLKIDGSSEPRIFNNIYNKLGETKDQGY